MDVLAYHVSLCGILRDLSKASYRAISIDGSAFDSSQFAELQDMVEN